MAKVRRVVVLFLLVLSVATFLGSCSLVTAIFGPDKNKIVAWVPTLTVGSSINYKESWSSTDPTAATGSRTFTATVQDIVETNSGDRKTVKINWDGTIYYAIYDNPSGKMYLSIDTTIDPTTDVNYLKTPIDTGTTWYAPFLDLDDFFGGVFPNTQYKIQNTKQTVDVGTDTVKDAVTISATLDTQYIGFTVNGNTVTAVTITFDYSPTYGFVGQTITINGGGYTYTDKLIVSDVTKA